MTRDDVANLVIRAFALWIGSGGLTALGALPWMVEGPGGQGATAAYALVMLGAAAALWLAAPPLTRAMFVRPDRDVPFAISAAGVPALASFVVGLIVLAGALPQAASWVGMQVLRSRLDASLLNPDVLPSLDQRSAGAGAEIVARLIVGGVLIAISRRPEIWSTPEVVAAEDQSDADEGS